MKKILLGSMAMLLVVSLMGCAGDKGDRISVITREDGSGTRGAFVEITGILEGDVDNSSK